LDRQDNEHRAKLEKDQELLGSRALLADLEAAMAKLKGDVEQASADL
jgi:hypothetical protein